MKKLSLHLVLAALVLLASATAAQALEPDEILLLTNKNVRESTPLAQFYANARQIPEGRILALPLPIFEEIAFVNYEQQVVPQIRQFLKENNLDKKVKCIVTFFGVPLRIGPHLLAEAQREELAALKSGRDKLLA